MGVVPTSGRGRLRDRGCARREAPGLSNDKAEATCLTTRWALVSGCPAGAAFSATATPPSVSAALTDQTASDSSACMSLAPRSRRSWKALRLRPREGGKVYPDE